MSRLVVIGEILGVVACSVAAALWVYLVVWNPYGERSAMTIGTYFVASAMVALAAWGAVESLKARYRVMYIVFLLSFIPEGLYTLGANSVAILIGFSNLLLLVAAVLVHLSARSGRAAMPSTSTGV